MTKPGQTPQDLLDLAGEYAEPDHDTWMAIVEKSLKGKPYEKLTKKSYDGIALKPLYTAAADALQDRERPGQAPYTRGHAPLGSTETGWDVRCFSSHPDPKEANRQILSDLEKGATSIWLKLDPTGKTGTVIKSRGDMESLLDDVFLDLAPVMLDPGGPSLPPAAYLMAVLEQRGVDAHVFHGNFGADPLSTLAAVGKVIVPMETLLGRMADLAAHVAKTYPGAKALNISSAIYHSAGCSEAQELGFALATAVEYLRHMTQAGLSVDGACQQTAFTLTCDADIFLSIAKLRVVRQLWAKIAAECGSSTAGQKAPIHAVTAPRMFSQRDPWVNILRSTAACFGAAVGGADAITVLPFESAIGLATHFGRRIARNTQIVLQEESGLSRVTDPAGGAWMMESLTDDLADSAWTVFQSIESQGGMASALSTGSVADMIAATEVERAKNIASRKDPLTGVSEFPDIAETPVDIDEPDLSAITAAADERATQTTGVLDSLPDHGEGALMEALVEAARNDSSAATIGTVLRGSPMEIKPLPQHRLAEHFETLRDAADHYLKTHGQRPKIFLANIGRIADFTARATFAMNLFEAGGFEVISGFGGDKPEDIVVNFQESDAPAVVICSTDAIYEDVGVAVAQSLKAADAALIFLATRPSDQEQDQRNAGVNDYIFMGCDVLDILKKTHTDLGVTQ